MGVRHSRQKAEQEIPADFTVVDCYDLLYRLGANAGTSGFFYTSYAVALVLQNPERLELVTKWLYPDVARQYHTNRRLVERNIRTVIGRVWKSNPELLRQLAGEPLEERPGPGQFIRIIAGEMHRQMEEKRKACD